MGTEVALIKKYESVKAFFTKEEVRTQLQSMVPSHVNAEKLLRVAFSVIKENPDLLNCTSRSLVGSILAGLQLGLSFEKTLGQAYLVPFKQEGVPQAQLIIGYRGLVTLARNSGEVAYVSAHSVFAKDVFELSYGTEERLHHVPADDKPGDFRGAYCVFHYKDGTKSFDYMSKASIDKIRARSKASNSGPWVSDYEEMAVKTVIRHHAKVVPLSVELAKAMALDERTTMGEGQEDLLPEINITEGETTGLPITPEGKSKIDTDFDKLVSEYAELENIDHKADPFYKSIFHFLSMVAKSNNSEVQAVKEEAIKKFPEFWAGFKGYALDKKPKKEKKEKTGADPSKGAVPEKQPEPKNDQPPNEPPQSLFPADDAEGADKW